jgi:hypothetical protein
MYNKLFFSSSHMKTGPDSFVGTATRLGPDGPGFEFRRGRDFLDPSRPAPRLTQPLAMGIGYLSQGKAAGAWRWTHTPFYCRGRLWVELCLYLPSMPACHVTKQLHCLYFNKTAESGRTGWQRVSYMMPVMFCISKYMWLMFYFPVFILSGAFAKLRKATPSFAMSVTGKSTPTGQIFTTFHIWIFSQNIPRKLKFHKNLTITVGTLLDDQCTFTITSG